MNNGFRRLNDCVSAEIHIGAILVTTPVKYIIVFPRTLLYVPKNILNVSETSRIIEQIREIRVKVLNKFDGKI